MKTYGEIHGRDENDWRSKNILQCGVSMLLYQQMGSCQNRKYKEMARHTIWSGGDDQDIEQESGKVGEGGQKPVNMGKLRKMNPAEFSSAWFHHPLWCLWTLGESSGWWLGCAATSDGGYYGECPAHIEQALTWNMVQHDLLVQPGKSGPETIFLLESSLISKMLQALPQEGLCLNPIEGQLWDASSLFRLHQNATFLWTSMNPRNTCWQVLQKNDAATRWDKPQLAKLSVLAMSINPRTKKNPNQWT